MIWIGLLSGAAIGGVIWGLPGALVIGFIGWLIGLAVSSRTNAGAAGPVRIDMPAQGLEARVERLEREVAELRAMLRGEDLPAAAPATEPGLEPGLEPARAPVVEPAREPVVEPARAPVVEPAAAFEPAQPAAEAGPPPPDKPAAVAGLLAWLTGGNAIARAGLVILFFGLAFLAKYAADHRLLPVELRVAGVALAGVALLVFGWRLREKSPGYALGLQGGGVAVLYLTTFAALRLWNLLPPEMAFALLALIAAFSAVLAVAQNAMSLAVIGAAGGFAAPILASTGGGSHVMLFGYYLLLNLGIAAIGVFRAWRPLNLTGFLFTFFIGLAWGLQYYRPEHRETTQPFLVAHWLLYVAIAVIFARRQAPELRKFVDGTLTFGTPLAAFALQAGLMRGVEMGLAWSSLAAAAFYVILGWILWRTGRESWRLLAQAFVALGVVFVTIAIPLALDARWTSAMWALEGAAIVWVGLKQDQRLARLFGMALQALAAAAFVWSYGRAPAAPPLLDARFIGAALLAGAGFWTHRQLLGARASVSPIESKLVPAFFVWALLWWLLAGEAELHRHLASMQQVSARVAFFASTALVLGWLALRWDWRHAAIATRWLLLGLVLCVFASLDGRVWRGQGHPFGHFGWIAWPYAIAVHFWLLKKLEGEPPWPILHAGGVWLAALVGALELHWLASTYTARGTAWSIAAVAVPHALLMLAAASGFARLRWPVAARREAYLDLMPHGLAWALLVWSVYANAIHGGRSDPLPYLPLVNALDLAHILAGLAVAAVVRALQAEGLASPLRSRNAAVIAGIAAFVWLNGVLLRTLHHWADIPYTFRAMERSVLAQASLSVFWSVLALGLMVYATRSARRALWMTGAALMGVVVVKLFAVDLSNVGGIERIVSFIAVGVLMLVIGYFSPVPPRRKEATP